eukprot:4020609-Pleurochrysis_carterae.AAC.1
MLWPQGRVENEQGVHAAATEWADRKEEWANRRVGREKPRVFSIPCPQSNQHALFAKCRSTKVAAWSRARNMSCMES